MFDVNCHGLKVVAMVSYFEKALAQMIYPLCINHFASTL